MSQFHIFDSQNPSKLSPTAVLRIVKINWSNLNEKTLETKPNECINPTPSWYACDQSIMKKERETSVINKSIFNKLL